jgi:predicted transcriptional regulator
MEIIEKEILRGVRKSYFPLTMKELRMMVARRTIVVKRAVKNLVASGELRKEKSDKRNRPFVYSIRV